MSETGFAIILNRIRYSGTLPFKMDPEIVFDRATREEAAKIVHFIHTGGFAPFGQLSYFTAIPREPGETGTYDYKHRQLPNVEFWILRFNSVNHAEKWALPFRLIDPEIEWSAYFYGRNSRNLIPATAFHYFQTNTLPYYTDLSESDLRDVQAIAEKLWGKVKAKGEIRGVVENFGSSRAYIRIGRMALLSHFTVLEGLLTHAPKENAGDSLNHQLSTKIPLLFHRMEKPPEQKRFGSIELGKLWKRLYGVRSQIAHGDAPDLKGLGSFDDVHQYVYLSMKALLRLALRESQLVYDLRAC
jgi:hypothetical protein